MVKVKKRDNSIVDFNKEKIRIAIEKAMKNGSGIYRPDVAIEIADEIELVANKIDREMTIYQIEDLVFSKLVEKGQELTAKAYEGYRAVQEFKRIKNTTDESILGLGTGENKQALMENSNKQEGLISTQRDLIAEEISKDLSKRYILPSDIVQAHDDGLIYIHDLGHMISKAPNCMLINLSDMLQNGTVINRKLIEKPKSLRTATTIASQIVAQIASGQFGGQTISISHLAPFVRISEEKLRKETIQNFKDAGVEYTDEQVETVVKNLLKKEIKDSMQTLQYQINTLQTSNGQAPFLSLFMYISENPEYEKETAMLIEEVLKQRIEGVKNEVGVPISIAFPKLLYALDENNIHEDSEYYWLTKLSAKCSAKRLVPDYLSVKILKQNYDGNVVAPMGCRAFLSPYKDKNGKDVLYGRFNMGVVSLNLPDAGLSAEGDLDKFWKILDERMELAKKALMIRYERLKTLTTTSSPIHWEHGGVTRLKKGESIAPLLEGGFATISLGYIGVNECVYALIGEHSVTEEGEKLAVEIVKKLREKVDKWKAETGLGFALYSSPSESYTGTALRATRKRFGVVEGVTDREYFTNSYHYPVFLEVDAFSKLKYESQFHSISSGGAISYVEIPNMTNNLDAVMTLVKYIYDNVQYAELNTKSDYCHICGFDGEILANDDGEWECPQCHNKDKDRMNVVRRTCGYIGESFWNEARTKEIKERVLHI